MKPPKPYSPYAHCDKCNEDYKHYNSSFSKCPRCEELKQLNDEKRGSISRPYPKSNFNDGNGKSNVRSERAGKNLWKFTNERVEGGNGIGKERDFKKKRTAITKVSAKQQAINNAIATLKKNRIERLGSFCEACGVHGWCSYAHIAPKSVAKELQLDPEGAYLACETCDYLWEHFKKPQECLKFLNLDTLLDFLWRKKKKRYYHVIDILKIEDKQVTINL